MSDSKNFDIYLKDVDIAKKLQDVFEELIKSNISILTPEVSRLLSEEAVYLEKLQYPDETHIRSMKYLIMICNILYNRTDLLVLPVEDGVYDLLLEAYRRFDPNFQVGSAVVQFRSAAEQLNPEIKNKICPFVKIPEENRDEQRQAVFDRLSSYDINKFDSRDFKQNPFIITEQNISKRYHNTKHNHPDLVGTLDKCKFVTDKEAIEVGAYNDPNVKILERDFFQKHIAEGIIDPVSEYEMVLELKYDGISVEADCNRQVVSARSRGDTGIGEASDMTPILAGYQFHRNTLINDPIGVKFEAIMTKSALEMFNEERGSTYANCRTAIIGLFGRSDAYRFRDYITLVPLAVDRTQVPEISDRIEEIEFCNNLFQTHGEPLRYMYIRGNVQQLLYQISKFVEEAYVFRDYVDFMFDGVVVSYLNEGIRARLGRENFINKYSMAVKFNPLSKLTIFTGYTYEVGQDGRICPMIHYNAVEFFGTIHTKSTGSGLSRFNDLHLKLGDIIKVTYVNDVMPYVTSVDCEQNRNNPNDYEVFPTVCPICGSPLVISDSGKTAFCPNIDCDGKVITRMSNMLQKMNVKGFAESTIRALGVRHFIDLMYLTYDQVALQIGPVNASNFMEAIDQIKNGNMFDYLVVGALGFTGVATNTWKLIFSNIKLKDLMFDLENLEPEKVIEGLCNINGIGYKTAKTIVDEYQYYRNDLTYILQQCKITQTLDNLNLMTKRKQIRFTGCRNLQLSEQLNKLGYDADGKAGVTKDTDILLVPYKGFTSNKVSRVSKNCVIIPIQEFESNMQKYLE